LLAASGCSTERKAHATTLAAVPGSVQPRGNADPVVPGASAIDTRAATSLSQMVQTLAQTQAFSFTALTTTEDVSSTLQKLQFDTSVRGSVKRPDKLFFEKTGSENVTLWFDGTTATLLDRTANTYLSLTVSGGLDGLMTALAQQHIEAPFAGLLRSDLSTVTSHVLTADYYGPSLVDDKTCDHLAFRQDNVDWQLWIDQATSLPKKAVITSKMLAAAPQHQLFVKDITTDQKIDDSTFQAALPPGAQQAVVSQ
jgi:hypothetical protein